MKYVIIDNNMPILFGVDGNHADFNERFPGKITSAGFALLENATGGFRVKIYGRSSSLNIGPSPEDGNIIYAHLTSEDPNRHK